MLASSSTASPSSRPARWVWLALLVILLLGSFLRFYQLGASGYGNLYYAAAVKSMLTSWSNFFYAAYEPGGSVTVDKPPLGLWFQVLSASLLGVNGFALALPQALAGVLSIAVLFALVRPAFGDFPALLAALALAVTPVAVATDRNNTMDSTLVFVLLLAAGAAWLAVRRARLRWLLLTAFLIGVGFNIKMLQAYLALPALFGLYLLGAPLSLKKRLAHLALASLLLLVVSFSWALAVDLTPADQRPFIGSSTGNSVLELVFGHNGLRRLLGGSLGRGAADGAPAGNLPARPYQPSTVPASTGAPATPITGEVDSPGLFRLFGAAIGDEIGWLLPLGLLAIPLLVLAAGWRPPWSAPQLALLLWAGWLLPELLYFSFTGGLMHAYYLVMLAPPLAALIAGGAWALAQIHVTHPPRAWGLTALVAGLTLAVQGWLATYTPQYLPVLLLPALALALPGLFLLLPRFAKSAALLGVCLLSAGLMAVPFGWSLLTTFNPAPNTALPNAGPADSGSPRAGLAPGQPGALPPGMDRPAFGNQPPGVFPGAPGAQQPATGQPPQSAGFAAGSEALLTYLLENTPPGSYLLAALSSQELSSLILATGRPALPLGGFSGSDTVLDAAGLAALIARGDLRFVLGGAELAQRKPEIGAWLDQHCRVVDLPGLNAGQMQPSPGARSQAAGVSLYDCAP